MNLKETKSFKVKDSGITYSFGISGKLEKRLCRITFPGK